MQWFKFYGQDWLTDLKIITMEPIDKLVFIYLLCLASISETPGLIKRCTETSLLKVFQLSQSLEAFGCLTRLEALGMIKVTESNETGFLNVEVVNFRKRQERALTTSERQALYRDRKKGESNEEVTGSLRIVTDSNEVVTLDKNRIEKNRVDKSRRENTNTSSAKALKKTPIFSQEGSDVIKAFESVDAKNQKYYQVPAQRKACDNLIKQYGLSQVIKVIAFLPKTNQLEYFPHITTPSQLENNWIRLRDCLAKEKKKITKLDLNTI